MNLTVTVKMAAGLLETGDVIALYVGYDEMGMAVVTRPLTRGEDDTGPYIETTYGRLWISPGDEATVKAAGAFRELGKQGARKMTWNVILEPTPMMLQETEMGIPRSCRAYLLRLKTEKGFAADHARRKRINAVLWHYSLSDMRPGSFEQKLVQALDQADGENFARLALGFPDEAMSTWIVKNMANGRDALTECLAHGDALARNEEHLERRLDNEVQSGEVRKVWLGDKEYMIVDVPDDGVLTPGSYKIVPEPDPVGDEACPNSDPHVRHVWIFQNEPYLCRGAVYEQGEGPWAHGTTRVEPLTGDAALTLPEATGH